MRWFVRLGSLALLAGFVGLVGQPRRAQQKAGAVHVTRAFGNQAADPACRAVNFLLSPETVHDAKDGSIRLAHSVLLADETGATDFRQTEDLKANVLVKKVFVLDSAEVTAAELFFYGSAREVHVNGKPASPPRPLAFTGWSRVAVVPGLLKTGENEIFFKGGQLLLEPGRRPGRSFKSRDGGRTWSNERLGARGDQQGEYLIRLRLGRYASPGWAVSQVFDLWAGRGGEIATPGKLLAVGSPASLTQAQPAGTRATAWLRTGPTPSPDEANWTAWTPLNQEYRPTPPAERHRWAQLKFELGTARPQATPRVPPGFQLSWDFLPDPLPAAAVKALADKDGPPDAIRGSTAFAYQGPSPRLKLLRERYQLDRVIAPGKTEMEQLMLLRYWVRNQWHTAWGSHPAAWMPPWDSLIILESKDQPDCLTMCTHYACVFTQCCQALGWDARHCILDHHCVAEVYVRQHDKWVMMDAGNSAERADVGLHFERGGIPLSARELHLAQRSGNAAGITVHFTPARLVEKVAPLCRPAPPAKAARPPRPDVVSVTDLGKYPVCGLDNYRRYAFPPRNTFLTTLVPGELEQGWSNYFYDGYCWVGDSPDEPRLSPEYSHHLDPARPQDVDWKVGWTCIHLARTGKAGELRVDLETYTPNLARFERVAPGGKAQPTPAGFVWPLRPGRNELAVRSVNEWDRAGKTARIIVLWEPKGGSR
jgi:hypothetical protein